MFLEALAKETSLLYMFKPDKYCRKHGPGDPFAIEAFPG